MSGPDPLAARAALEAARVAFDSMTAASDPNGTLAADVSPPAGIPSAMPSGMGRAELLTMAVRARGAWVAAQQVLQLLASRSDLDGQALVAEARKQELLSLDDAHALVALHSWMERSVAPGSAAHSLTIAPTSAEQSVATASLAALERAVMHAAPLVPDAMPPFRSVVATGNEGAMSAAPAPTWSRPATTSSSRASTPPASIAPGSPAAAPASAMFQPHRAPAANAPTTAAAPEYVVPTTGSSQSSAWIILLVIIGLMLGAGGAGWYVFKGRGELATSSAYTDGVAAYQRGAMEVARQAFVRASQADPADAQPLIFLGRIARESGDLAQSRRHLENAVRLAPDNELALRELGSVMLADGQPELARRFYVRALERDAADKLAQGFLGCALIRLQRVDEGKRWLERAGPGDWSRCAPDTTQAPR